MLVEFKKLRAGDKFSPEVEIHGPVDTTRDGRVWERSHPEKQIARGPFNARTADNFHPKLVEWFHSEALVWVVDCPYCEQVNYIKTLEWEIRYFEPCGIAHTRIEGAIHMTYGTILGMDTCHHLTGTEWDISEEGR